MSIPFSIETTRELSFLGSNVGQIEVGELQASVPTHFCHLGHGANERVRKIFATNCGMDNSCSCPDDGDPVHGPVEAPKQRRYH